MYFQRNQGQTTWQKYLYPLYFVILLVTLKPLLNSQNFKMIYAFPGDPWRIVNTSGNTTVPIKNIEGYRKHTVEI